MDLRTPKIPTLFSGSLIFSIGSAFALAEDPERQREFRSEDESFESRFDERRVNLEKRFLAFSTASSDPNDV